VRQIGFLFFLIGFLKPIHCQKLNADALLNKTIKYHDPNSLWNEFKASFFVTMESAEGSLRKSKINLDLKHSFFNLSVKVDENQWTSSIDRGVCKLSFNGSQVINPEIEKKFGLNCERALMYRNYYTYLYGLPMKLKDPGTILSPKVLEKTINGLSYWVLKVNYKPEDSKGWSINES